jgi:hypothetical protein
VGEGRGVKPARRLGVETAVAGAAAEEVESAGGARVLGDYLGDGGGWDTGGGGDAPGSDADLEVERRGAPEVAPPVGDDRRAAAVFGGEEGDDGAEDGVGEPADEIVGRSHAAVDTPSSLRCGPKGFGGRRTRGLLLLQGRRPASRNRDGGIGLAWPPPAAAHWVRFGGSSVGSGAFYI